MRNTTKVEALIESCRSEGKWQRVIELTEELKTGSPNNGNQMNYNGLCLQYITLAKTMFPALFIFINLLFHQFLLLQNVWPTFW